MKLSGSFHLFIQGNTDRYITESLRRSGFEYHVDRLFSGKEVAESALSSWGLTVTLAADLRDVTEDDVEAALAGSYVEEQLAGVERAALLEFYQRMLDAKIGEPDD